LTSQDYNLPQIFAQAPLIKKSICMGSLFFSPKIPAAFISAIRHEGILYGSIIYTEIYSLLPFIPEIFRIVNKSFDIVAGELFA